MSYLVSHNFTVCKESNPISDGICSVIIKNVKTGEMKYLQRNFREGKWMLEDDDEEIIAWTMMPSSIEEVLMLNGIRTEKEG